MKDITEYHPRIVDSRYFNRYLAFYGLLCGAFSLMEFVSLFFLPARFRDYAVTEKRYRYEEEYWKRRMRMFLGGDGSAMLFSRRFSTVAGNYAELRSLIWEMIVNDQYATREFVRDGGVVIDAGANIGMFSVKTAHDFPHAEIYAFEPSARTFQVLTENAAPYPNIICVNQGLGEQEGKKKIFQKESEAGGARLEDSSIGALRSTWERTISEEAAITTIDSFMKGKRVDFIKIDTEGYEANILKGAAETIRRWKPAIAMSAYHNAGDKKELPQLVRSICPEYECELRLNGGENLICRLR